MFISKAERLRKALKLYYADPEINLVDKLEFARELEADAAARSAELTRLISYNIAKVHIAPILPRLSWTRRLLNDGRYALVGVINQADKKANASLGIVMQSYHMFSLGVDAPKSLAVSIRFSPYVAGVFMPTEGTLTFYCEDQHECQVLANRYELEVTDYVQGEAA